MFLSLIFGRATCALQNLSFYRMKQFLVNKKIDTKPLKLFRRDALRIYYYRERRFISYKNHINHTFRKHSHNTITSKETVCIFMKNHPLLSFNSFFWSYPTHLQSKVSLEPDWFPLLNFILGPTIDNYTINQSKRKRPLITSIRFAIIYLRPSI